MNPKVSIIIPVYNGANFVSEAIECALHQTYNNIEIIVVNDGSKDDGATRKAVQKYKERIKYFEKENGGVSTALNYGIQNMTGEYFAWLSHDDMIDAIKIEKQIELLKGADKKTIVLCDTEFVNKSGVKLDKSIKGFKEGFNNSEEAIKQFFKGAQINGCGLLIPRCAFDEVGLFTTEYRYLQDAEMWYRLFFSGYSLIYSPEKLVKTRIHDAQVTVQKSYLYEKEKREISPYIIESVRNLDSKLLVDYLYDCEQKGLHDIAKIVIKSLKEEKLWSLDVQTKALIFRFYGTLRPYIRKIYYKMKFGEIR